MCPVAALSTLTEQKIGEQYDTMVVDIIPTLNDWWSEWLAVADDIERNGEIYWYQWTPTRFCIIYYLGIRTYTNAVYNTSWVRRLSLILLYCICAGSELYYLPLSLASFALNQCWTGRNSSSLWVRPSWEPAVHTLFLAITSSFSVFDVFPPYK